MPEPLVSVFTATLPEREELLWECIESVQAQTTDVMYEHVIEHDHNRVGLPVMMNRLLERARGEWLAWIADDDVMYAHHLETLLANRDGADIVYSWCDVVGRDWKPNSHFDPDRLKRENYIPATTLIRTDLARQLNGWRNTADGFEDWDFWKRALAAGAVFRCVPVVTWKYRFDHGLPQATK
jgi:hypothetical protein